MTRNPLKSVTVLLVAMLALSVALVGTATVGNAAGAITKAQVKKIAKKVANKVVTGRAPTLSVGNATNLNGQPATAYQDNATVYTSTFAATAATTRVITIPLAPGNYEIGYSAFLPGGSGYTFCQVRRVRTSPANTLNVADDTVDTAGGPSVSAVGVVDVLAGDVVTLRCNSATAFGADPSQPIQIIVTPLDSVTNGGGLTAAKGTVNQSRG